MVVGSERAVSREQLLGADTKMLDGVWPLDDDGAARFVRGGEVVLDMRGCLGAYEEIRHVTEAAWEHDARAKMSRWLGGRGVENSGSDCFFTAALQALCAGLQTAGGAGVGNALREGASPPHASHRSRLLVAFASLFEGLCDTLQRTAVSAHDTWRLRRLLSATGTRVAAMQGEGRMLGDSRTGWERLACPAQEPMGWALEVLLAALCDDGGAAAAHCDGGGDAAAVAVKLLVHHTSYADECCAACRRPVGVLGTQREGSASHCLLRLNVDEYAVTHRRDTGNRSWTLQDMLRSQYQVNALESREGRTCETLGCNENHVHVSHVLRNAPPLLFICLDNLDVAATLSAPPHVLPAELVGLPPGSPPYGLVAAVVHIACSEVQRPRKRTRPSTSRQAHGVDMASSGAAGHYITYILRGTQVDGARTCARCDDATVNRTVWPPLDALNALCSVLQWHSLRGGVCRYHCLVYVRGGVPVQPGAAR